MATQLVTPPMNPNSPIALSTRTLTQPVQVGEEREIFFYFVEVFHCVECGG